MRVLLITPLFYPEPYYLRGLPFAKGLLERGVEVEVLTGFPNYPKGQIYPGYRMGLWRQEVVEGVRITRVPWYLSHDTSGLKRTLCYLSMALSMALQGPLRAPRVDLVHVNQGPATLCLPADLLRVLRRVPYLLDVQDLWPESVLDSNMLRLPAGARILQYWSNHTYKWARHIITPSEGIRDRLVELGVRGRKVTVVHNWCDQSVEKPLPERDACPDSYRLQGRFNIVYAGNFGPLQALPAIIEGMTLLQNSHPQIQFVLVGDGLDEGILKRAVEERRLRNVRFLPRKPPAELNQILAYADALLVHLRDSPLNRVGIPSKVGYSLAAGRPILIGARGSAPALVARAQAGIAFEPENGPSLAAAARRLYEMPEEGRRALGYSGRKHYLEHLAFNIGMSKLVDVYHDVCTNNGTHRQGRTGEHCSEGTGGDVRPFRA
ncbi:MAG TPA: glycosyltransferase family 4 protein [Sedimentisphaerales bacterium]|jgi:glycosyltransferase involved in cell wall biosynthesis|nr:glycosyltransferase family 4 protein [Sedimentisphaerales bacterium]